MSTTTASAAAPRASRLRLRLPDSVSVLAERDFRVVWMGQAISRAGTWMQMVAQGLLVLTLWNSAFALGALNFANAGPSLLVLLFGGVLADRADKRRILLLTQTFMAALAVAVGVLIIGDAVQYWMLIVATIALGIAFGYDLPAYQAFLPELVPPAKVGQVVALNSSTFHGTRLVGPALAGVVIGLFGLATAYFLNAASFIAVIVSLLIVRYRPVPSSVHEGVSALDGLREGLRHARQRANLRALLWLTALNTTFLFPVVAVLTPFYVKNVLHQGPGVLGLLWAGSGLGSMLGAFALIWWGDHARPARIILAAVFAPIGLVILAVVHQPLVALAVMPFLSFSFSSQLGLIQTMIQESTPAQFRGRVMSLHGITFNGTMPIAALAFSALAVVTDLPFVMVTCALLYGVSAAIVLRSSGGGVTQVVADCRAEYERVTLEPVPVRPS
jgi:MFS family permease